MAERRQERRFRPERAAGRSRTRGCGLVQLGLKEPTSLPGGSA
jgi:hypothetical protein